MQTVLIKRKRFHYAAILWLACLIYTKNSSAATYVVTTLLDAGAGSLRQAIINANASAGNDLIIFNLGVAGPYTIGLTTALPALTDNAGVTIDGWTNTGNNGTPNTIPVFSATTGTPLNPIYKIILGNSAAVPTGIIISSTNNLVQGFVMQNFGDGTPSANDIAITISANSNTVLGCYIGMDVTGTTRGTRTAIGIQISGANNLIGDGTAAGANLISGMNASLYGIYITGAGATGNNVKGDLIGLQKDGSTLVAGATQVYGVNITTSAASNIIGGSVAGEGNVISGNTTAGINLSSAAVAGNSIRGNIIGTQANGTTFVTGNPQQYGLYVNASPNNTIGGSTVPERNIISANEAAGFRITGAGSMGNVIKGNYIGIDITGTTFITSSNQDRGIYQDLGAGATTIGGTVAGEGNLISGNNNAVASGEGIALYSSSAIGNTVVGNSIGPQVGGAAWVNANLQHYGIMISSSPNNIVGGNTSAARNIISANESVGLRITGAPSTGNIVSGNYVGIDISGTTFIAGSTQDRGIYIDGSAVSNIIGGIVAGEGNVVSGNKNAGTTADGIYLTTTAPATGNSVMGNIVGLQTNGISFVAGNGQGTGINVANSPGNIIGGGTVAHRNIISGNETYGIYISGASSIANFVRGNYIGTENTGTSFVTGSNQDYGVYITTSAASTTIGGIVIGEGNLISGNSSMGIYLLSTAAIGSSIQQNTVGPAAGAISTIIGVTGQQGIYLSGSTNNLIGGTLGVNSRNIISCNNNNGLSIGGTSSNNIAIGNYIGIAFDGITRIPGNIQTFGAAIFPPAFSNTIGGLTANEANVMSGNTVVGGYYGIGNTIGNAYLGNIIGLQASGTASVVGNTQSRGFDIHGSGLTIGSTGGGRNIISGNTSIGIYNALATASNNIIRANYIGPGSNGLPVAVQATGIQIQQSASNYTVGGYLGGFGLNPEANLIAFNTGNGVNITSLVSVGNLVSRNLIHTNGTGGTQYPINLNYGVNQGNNGKPIPVITGYSAIMVIGNSAATAGVGDTVEVFANTTGNCKDMMRYLGSTIGDAAGNWTLTGITVNTGESLVATARTIAANNTSQVSICTPTILPVELLYFEAVCDAKKVKLQWATASEHNSDYFTIERSENGTEYKILGMVPAAGESNVKIEYSFTDEYASASTVYYRLKQTDHNGEYEYFDIIFSHCDRTELPLSVYPNPADEILIINGVSGDNVEFEITDALGKTIFRQIYVNTSSKVEIPVETFGQGVYILKISSNDKPSYFKFFKN